MKTTIGKKALSLLLCPVMLLLLHPRTDRDLPLQSLGRRLTSRSRPGRNQTNPHRGNKHTPKGSPVMIGLPYIIFWLGLFPDLQIENLRFCPEQGKTGCSTVLYCTRRGYL